MKVVCKVNSKETVSGLDCFWRLTMKECRGILLYILQHSTHAHFMLLDPVLQSWLCLRCSLCPWLSQSFVLSAVYDFCKTLEPTVKSAKSIPANMTMLQPVRMWYIKTSIVYTCIYIRICNKDRKKAIFIYKLKIHPS